MTAIEPGMSLAQSVVPSSGSTAISTFGPVFVPTFSPMNSIGASSRSPSPMTIVPSIGRRLSSRRRASTAAWSAAFSSPRPRRRADDTAARSVTRTSSSVRMRSMIFSSWMTRSATLLSEFLLPFDANDLRLLGDGAVGDNRLDRLAHELFGRRISDQDDRHRTSRPRPGAGIALLHDAFERNLPFRHALGDRRDRAGLIDCREADVIAALMPLHRDLFRFLQSLDGETERCGANAFGNVGDIGNDGGGRRLAAGARAD